MQVLIEASVVLFGYILGSIPFGLIFVKLISGKDIRTVASGRTGGTNAGRAAGLGAGLLTALMDGAKATAAVWTAQAVAPHSEWLHILAPIGAILGHNYSIFLAERDQNDRLRLRGGAGGGPTVGGAIGLWWPSGLIVLPLAALVFFGIGYASITTISIALLVTAVFGVRYAMGLATLPDLLYGAIALCLLIWALRPNIRALIEGRERFHGWRPWRHSSSETPQREPKTKPNRRATMGQPPLTPKKAARAKTPLKR